ncbi:DUF4231 domain-containing protein [Nocardioides sp. LHG3406-4]|uniref:DUF4231 domain-containing protein n=1 Tax=Nocardioides sp. LHG3406-4 TaxID=2804575 RepID=UPI003CED69F1
MPALRKVTDDDMPQLFQAADKSSLNAQTAFVDGTRLRLGLVVLAAALGVTAWRVGASNIDVLAVASTLLFVGALLVEGFLWKSRPDKTWYDARAIAESAKTLAWKYAVRGEPFNDPDMSEEDTTRSLLDRLNGIQRQYSHVGLEAVNVPAVSQWMREQRQDSWSERKEVYRRLRLVDQKDWYAKKAKYNKERSTQWRVALVATEFLGVVASLLSAFSESVPLFGPALAALVVAVVAWLETKQHDFNARAYSAAVSDLAQAEARLDIAEDEAAWAQEVENAEEAISREHTLWLASRNEP